VQITALQMKALLHRYSDWKGGKRAFERIDRVILLYHMQVEGIDDEELSWFRDYLTGRKQMAKFGKSTSSEQHNELGVTQGSCLAPSLFIFYMNRIARAVGEAKFNIFADDTLISVAEDSLEDGRCAENKQLTPIFITLIQTS
jgi:hypothetical protein